MDFWQDRMPDAHPLPFTHVPQLNISSFFLL
jgi:hypothetical protein